MKYAIFDDNGFPLAFYSREIHGDSIPENAVEISDGIWGEFIENQGFRRWVNGEILIYQPEPISQESYPSLYAIADIIISNGSISSVNVSAKISAVFYIDVGTYWVFFAETQPNTNYIPLCYNHNHTVFVSEKTEDFFVVSALSDGIPSDPSSLSVEVKRVQ